MKQPFILEKIEFTKRQTEAVNYKGDQMLLRGIAGSGKTLVLMGKAVKVARKYPNDKIVFICYGEPLSKAIGEQLNEAGFNNITVINFNKWISAVCRSMKKVSYLRKNRKNPSKVILENTFEQLEVIYPNHRFIKDERFIDFILEEISWIKGSANTTKEKYLVASRRGRGGKVNVSKADREVLFDIYTTYEVEKKGKHDYDDDALYVYNNLDDLPTSQKMDHIFIDEAQDLPKTALTVLINAAQKTCTVGADLGQKIYSTSFTWNEVGLNVLGGRTKILGTSFRSTKQIVLLAESLQAHDEIRKDEEYTALSIPDIEGDIPKLFILKSKEGHDEALINALKQTRSEDPEGSIGVLIRNWETYWGIRLQTVYKKGLRQKFNDNCLNHDIIKNGENGSHLKPGIHITSFHTAKGLEFDYVYVVDLVDPTQAEKLGEEFDWNVERRLLYVAMTRARASLGLFTYNENTKLITEFDSKLMDKIYL
ncbi:MULTISPECIES: 3'-5' exonuclease [Bacilli]|uniref:DNA 3'-5' helicase n=1 Tax=Lysinibacillus capsici TaxID=2115968 RepID=A0ABY8KNV6_9BACI|nr:3'-5' exonuclease [Lysinibacillus capsici]WGF40661.1 3'-5' exonuclease [Lysinibacillus capsici]